MKKLRSTLMTLAALVAAATLSLQAQAASVSYQFSGSGVSGAITLTYGAATDAKYADAYQVTGVSGTFSDANNGLNIVNATIGGLVAATGSTPEATNLLAPNGFTRFPVATGLQFGSLSFDNLYWPAGSPQSASDYPFHGGFLDIYGLLFDIGEGRVVNLWSNGDAGDGIDYGAAVVTVDQALDYVGGGVGVAAVPEPGSLLLVGVGLAALFARRRRAIPGEAPAAAA